MHRIEIIVISTLAFASTAWLLSSVLPAFLEILPFSKAAAGVLFVLGIFLLLLEVNLTHIGMVWLMDQTVAEHIKSVDHGALVWLSAGLSTFNIFAKWSFLVVVSACRELREAQRLAEEKEGKRVIRLKNRIEREKAGVPVKGKKAA